MGRSLRTARRTSRPTSAARRRSSPAARSLRCWPGSTRASRPRASRRHSRITLPSSGSAQRAARGALAHPDDRARHGVPGGRHRALSELAHARGLKVHMDGARFANAVAFLGCHPGDITWRAGVDVLSFGATKNGALAAEAVVFFDTAAGARFRAAAQARRAPALQVALHRRPAARLRRERACGGATPSAPTPRAAHGAAAAALPAASGRGQ